MLCEVAPNLILEELTGELGLNRCVEPRRASVVEREVGSAAKDQIRIGRWPGVELEARVEGHPGLAACLGI